MNDTSNKVAFYVLGSKGFSTIKLFIDTYGSESVSYIVFGIDEGVENDFSAEIKEIASKNSIRCLEKSGALLEVENKFLGWKFAIGWKWIIDNTSQLIVLHDSLLPKYRGFSPLVNSLINRETMIGVTALFASSEYDKGEIIEQTLLEIDYPMKIKELICRIEPLYFNLVNQIFSKIKKNINITSKAQDEKQATYSLWLDKVDYFIDWSWSAEKIKRFVDATGSPYDNAKSALNGKIVKLVDVKVAKDVNIEMRERHIGKVVFMDGGSPTIICGQGLLSISTLLDNNNNNIKIDFRSRFE